MRSLQERFWDKVNKTETCWLWTGALDKDFYGRFNMKSVGGGASEPAFRVAYVWERGPIADGLQLDHLCKVRACVNPAHLEPVTPNTNRRRAGKLNAVQVLEIRTRLGTTSKAALAREYGVSFMTITYIERRQSWKDI